MKEGKAYDRDFKTIVNVPLVDPDKKYVVTMLNPKTLKREIYYEPQSIGVRSFDDCDWWRVLKNLPDADIVEKTDFMTGKRPKYPWNYR